MLTGRLTGPLLAWLACYASGSHSLLLVFLEHAVGVELGGVLHLLDKGPGLRSLTTTTTTTIRNASSCSKYIKLYTHTHTRGGPSTDKGPVELDCIELTCQYVLSLC